MKNIIITKSKNNFSVFAAIFGKKETINTLTITERVKSFEDACAELGIKSKNFFSGCVCDELTESDVKAIVAYAQLIIIARALNGVWKPNWEDANEYKYWPYFNMQSGVGFSFVGCAYWFAATAVGSRLCFKSREVALYAGKQFEELYKDYLLLN